MAERIFVIAHHDGKTTRIRAASFKQTNLGDGFWSVDFFEEGKSEPSAEVSVQLPYSVIPQDMLFDSLSDSLIYPAMSPTAENSVDFLGESLFSEAEKAPFTLEERRLLIEALHKAKTAIRDTFDTNSEQQNLINEKLDYLAEKVAVLDKFNWKRLFISVLVGVSVDLGFGTLIPSGLLAAIREVLTHIIEKAHGKIADKKRLPKA